MNDTVVMVVEDDTVLREALSDTLRLAGYQPLAARDGLEALSFLEQHRPAMIVTDIQMPRMDGHSLLRKIKLQFPETPVLLMTAYGTVQKAVEAMRDGAVDYLTKPFEAEVLVTMVERYAKTPAQGVSDPIAVDARMREVVAIASRVAATEATVMITGESGTGKEVLARFIHAQSPRAEQPFVAINCAAIPENMLEATLFGYEKGAFTGAYKSSPGKFEQAQGGTLLLDEISEMDLALQAKLLRVLQEREVERIGASKPVALDVRVLATSNRSLRREVEEGNFREDLFYRLNVFPLHVPPLRERGDDVIAIAERLVAKHAAKASTKVPVLSECAKQALRSQPWPGNVRELDNVIQRTLILHNGGSVSARDLRLEQAATPLAPTGFDESLSGPAGLSGGMRSHEHGLIIDALSQSSGNRKLAADKLGISERTLRYKLARMRDDGVAIPGRYSVAL